MLGSDACEEHENCTMHDAEQWYVVSESSAQLTADIL